MTDIIIERPKRYFALHFLLLRFLGLGWWHHPDENDTRNFPSWYLYYAIVTQLVWVAGFVGLETIDPFVGEKDLDRFMFSLSFVITHDLTLIKLYLFYFRNKDIQEIVRILEIDLYHFYQNNNKNQATIRTSRIFTGAFLFFGWMTIGNSNVYGIVQDTHWKSIVTNLNDTTAKPLRALPQPIYIPWPYQKEAAYIPTFALETIGLLWTGHIVMTIDTFIGSVILHMSTQFAILREAIVTAYDRSMVSLQEAIAANVEEIPFSKVNMDKDDKFEYVVRLFYGEEEIEKVLQTTLVSCFRQHQVLIK